MNRHLPILSEKELLIADLMTGRSKSVYGLDMIKKSEGKLKSGTVYVTLNRMEEKGYVSSKTEMPRPGFKGLPRRLYKLESKGQKALTLTKDMLKKLGAL